LENFRKPNSIENVVKQFEKAILQKEESDDIIKNFFCQMIDRNFLISVNETVNPKVKFDKNQLKNFKITYVLQKNQVITTAIALDTQLNEKVILKFLTTDSNSKNSNKIQFFRQEFEIMEKIGSHPLIRSLKSFDKNKNLAVMEYINGRNLKELILIGKLKMKHKLYLAYQVIESLSVLHEKKIIHGDVHIGQFLVEPNLNIKLIDFGMSAMYLENNVVTSSVRGGVCHYIEPENISDSAFSYTKDYIPCFYVDIYRLGIVLYFLIYEKFPFDSFSWKRLSKRIGSTEPDFESSIRDELVPAFVIEIIRKSLSKNPEMRFQSATKVFAFFDKAYTEIDKETA
jgi:serine/threonine protein kinase